MDAGNPSLEPLIILRHGERSLAGHRGVLKASLLNGPQVVVPRQSDLQPLAPDPVFQRVLGELAGGDEIR